MDANSYFQYGAMRLQLAKRTPTGYPCGMVADPANIPANTVMHARVVKGLRSFDPPVREVGEVTDRGDSTLYGTAYTGVKSYGRGSFEIGHEDEDLQARLNKSSLDTTISSEMVFRAGNDADVDPESYFLMASARCQDEDGTKYYRTEVWYNVQIRQSQKAPTNQADGENPSPLKYEFIPSTSERTITGHLLSDTTLDVVEDHDTHCVIRSNKPLALTSWKANGSLTTFKLGYLPLSNDATGDANNVVTLNGATHTVTSITPATAAVVIAAAGSSGDWWVVLYETAWKAVPA